MKAIYNYIKEILQGIWTLLTGMRVTAKYFFTPWKHVTQQYPENRDTLKIADRFRGEVIMPHNENNEHKCTGCGICEINCPNGSIEIITKTLVNEEGKRKGPSTSTSITWACALSATSASRPALPEPL